MTTLTFIDKSQRKFEAPKDVLEGKRHLTKDEIETLEKQLNRNTDSSWENFWVTDGENNFDASLINNSTFDGFIVLGRLRKASLKYHDLSLDTGIYRSNVRNIVTGNDNVIRNVNYLENYRLGERVMLFNVQEMSCTNHSKFGNGILKEGEDESVRVWIGVGNENDGRAVLPFESMIPADAYIWSHYREDEKLLERFKELTEKGNSKKLDTYGWVDNDVVIKNTTLIKDAKIGAAAYIKGAFKLKNITILSSEEEPSQIGEGVEMVNGIMGYGSRVFYQAVAVRFVIGRNCQLKYGARVLNTVLGDNSTVSCCELLNNLVFPFHEQHHNSSFLIAATVGGQSNIASGATIGSNHNSRSPDGEIFAKRGFWPGLCSDFKHNSRFASYTLVSKGSYQNELDISYPFALVAPGDNGSNKINIMPAFWFMYDMFAIARNNNKFIKRDKRVHKIQHIETDPLAPDTMQEIMVSIDRLIWLTSQKLFSLDAERAGKATNQDEMYINAKDYMHCNPEASYTLDDYRCQKKYGSTIVKPVQAYKMYRKIIKYFATRTLVEFCKAENSNTITPDILEKMRQIRLFTKWENAGGQIIPSELISELREKIKTGEIDSWEEVHAFYDECDRNYAAYKTRYSIYLLEQLYSTPIENFSEYLYNNIIGDVTAISNEMYNASIESREKDYTDFYRQMVYNSKEEMEKVLGSLKDNSFLKEMKITTEEFNKDLETLFNGLMGK
mgnify:CR=1 FL=1